MIKLEREDFNRLLIMKFPCLKEKYFDEVNWQEGDSTGSHVVYGSVLTPYLVECIMSENLQDTKKIFEFLEEILSLRQAYSENVIACSVIESITLLLMDRDYLHPLLGSISRTIFEDFRKETFL